MVKNEYLDCFNGVLMLLNIDTRFNVKKSEVVHTYKFVTRYEVTNPIEIFVPQSVMDEGELAVIEAIRERVTIDIVDMFEQKEITQKQFDGLKILNPSYARDLVKRGCLNKDKRGY